MNFTTKNISYIPGTYAKKRRDASQLAHQYIKEWERHRLENLRKNQRAPRISKCISFSRKIGVGALEVADFVSERLGVRVVDREILEHIAGKSELSESTVEFFDEYYPGWINEFGSYLFSEKSYTMGDYMRNLASTVYAIADSGPTIFVGRAAHLILPRDRVLAVRIISSKNYRVRRIAGILNVSEEVAEKLLDEKDRQQRDFFKKNFRIKEAPVYEFDIVINRDFIPEANWAADIVAIAYNLKFETKKGEEGESPEALKETDMNP